MAFFCSSGSLYFGLLLFLRMKMISDGTHPASNARIITIISDLLTAAPLTIIKKYYSIIGYNCLQQVSYRAITDLSTGSSTSYAISPMRATGSTLGEVPLMNAASKLFSSSCLTAQ